MARRLIIDTGVLVAAERGLVSLDDVVTDDDDPALAAVTVAELLVGVELADDAHRVARQTFVDDLLAVVPVEDYTMDVARAHARLLADARRTGRTRGAYDLLVAATAIATARVLVTTDASAGLGDLPGVDVVLAAIPRRRQARRKT